MDLRTSALVACLAWALGATVAAIGMLTYTTTRTSPQVQAEPADFRGAQARGGGISNAARNQLDRQAQLTKQLAAQVAHLESTLSDSRARLSVARSQVQQLKRESDQSIDMLIDMLEQSRLGSDKAAPVELPKQETSAVDKPMDPVVKAAEGGSQEEGEETVESLKEQIAILDQEIEALEIEHEATLARLLGRDLALRDESTRILSRLGANAAAEVAESLRHRDPEVRIWAANVLAKLGPLATDALGDLQAIAMDDDERVRTAVKGAMQAIAD